MPHSLRHLQNSRCRLSIATGGSMGKCLLPLIAFLLLSLQVEAQKPNKVERFINQYGEFVDEVVATPFSDFHGDTLNHIRRQQRCFMRRYRWFYDTRMSVEQLERFNILCGRYQRKIKALNRRRRLAATTGRIKGRLEGIFSRPEHPSDTLYQDTIPLWE